ncbi:YjcG family protein [Litchfieldia salsa]|uniref:Putative phosphoesterase SAMN05216565_102505 n=1 Tax=Litchfieldia salsa TaxID=930152 RepID=A0A1H0S1V1_9BACI|nr:YjcG family protein [Litchfieldia salsa]SDP35801.1 2'-5' RNA ligase [Litchfieldia salsa]
MKYGIAFFPSKELQDLANSYRMRYDPHYALIPPHITLKNPFEAENEELKTITDKLHDISKNHSSIPLNIVKVSSFYPVNNVIYLKIELNSELLNLHSALNSGFFHDNSDYQFVPHITIGQSLSDDEHSDVLGQLRMSKVQHKETIDRFHLLYQLENGSWTVYETFQLGKDC